MPEIGPTAECFAALFTGLTAFLIWRGMQPAKPEIQTELLGRPTTDRPRQIVVKIRNPDPRYTLTVEDVKSGQKAAPIEATRESGLPKGKRIAPGSEGMLVFYCRGAEAPDKLLFKLRIAHHRVRCYTVKISRRDRLSASASTV